MMHVVVTALAFGFVAQPLHASQYAGPRTVSQPRMGFFDDMKGAFSNDARLPNKDVNAGVNKKAPGYVNKKIQERKQAEQPLKTRAEKKGDIGIQTGNERMDELLSGWTWK